MSSHQATHLAYVVKHDPNGQIFMISNMAHRHLFVQLNHYAYNVRVFTYGLFSFLKLQPIDLYYRGALL